jgi:tight adherence protein E
MGINRTSKIGRNRGVATIEFTIGFIAFWFVCMAWAELSYMSYVSAVTDSIVSEAARESKVAGGNYESLFQQVVSENDSIWSGTINPNKFELSVNYFSNLEYLVGLKNLCKGTCTRSNDAAIALYRLEYQYSGMLTSLFKPGYMFSREVIVIQENERHGF